MLESKVETGLRLATPTMAWAARWNTVRISRSPSTRSTSGLVDDVTVDHDDPPVETVERRAG